MPMMEPQEDPGDNSRASQKNKTRSNPQVQPQNADDNSRASQKNKTRSNSQVQPQNTEGKKGEDSNKKQQQKNIHSFFD